MLPPELPGLYRRASLDRGRQARRYQPRGRQGEFSAWGGGCASLSRGGQGQLRVLHVEGAGHPSHGISRRSQRSKHLKIQDQAKRQNSQLIRGCSRLAYIYSIGQRGSAVHIFSYLKYATVAWKARRDQALNASTSAHKHTHIHNNFRTISGRSQDAQKFISSQ